MTSVKIVALIRLYPKSFAVCCQLASFHDFGFRNLKKMNKITENEKFSNRRCALEIFEICVFEIIFVISVSLNITNDPEATAVMKK